VQPPNQYDPYRPHAAGPQYPGQYQPQYQYPSPAPPPPKPMSRTVIAVIVVVVVLAVVLPMLLAGVFLVFLQSTPQSGGTVETNLGLRVSPLATGGWLIDVTSGSKPTSSVTLQVIDPATGLTTVSRTVSFLAPPYNDPDATHNDNNQNKKLDAGDTIQLKTTGGHIAAGYQVRLLSGSSVVGTIRELPA